jgi:hypothetical protein
MNCNKYRKIDTSSFHFAKNLGFSIWRFLEKCVNAVSVKKICCMKFTKKDRSS